MDPVKIETAPENLEPVKQVLSEQFTINWRDILRGAILAVISAVLTTVQQIIEVDGIESIKWKTVATVALGALISYLALNFASATRTIRVYKKESIHTKTE